MKNLHSATMLTEQDRARIRAEMRRIRERNSKMRIGPLVLLVLVLIWGAVMGPFILKACGVL